MRENLGKSSGGVEKKCRRASLTAENVAGVPKPHSMERQIALSQTECVGKTISIVHGP